MRPPYYEVRARCRGPKHKKMHWFTVTRKEVARTGTDGHKYTVKHVVCPLCKCWADVTRIVKIKEAV